MLALRLVTGVELPPVCIGLKFFNVFGPNEYHKGGMASLITQQFSQIASGTAASLFRSYNPDYADGEQVRDFVYVHDATDVVLWLLENANPGTALYNVGSSEANSFISLVHACSDALGIERRVDFVEMPVAMRAKYQYFTKANDARLRAAGYNRPWMTLQDSVAHFIGNYLQAEDLYR